MTTADANKRRIVVGVDGSIESQAALRWAVKLAPALGCAIEAVTAWEFPVIAELNPGLMNAGVVSGFPDLWHPEEDAKRQQERALHEVFGDGVPADVITDVKYGHASSVLRSASEGAVMLIVGSRGHGGFTGLLLGSVSATIAEHAACPVLVVHERQLPDN